ncbi:uncharacterized protein LOC128728431 [Anopheles nili]|uniref:uncharacterized protein LOC128728431 n=1 Tax=Anopheles nili TaxID=185578 RepID=UPI00237B339F|nr:uncharacterized protein LOC128728431 [Anopheles nili]XP_053678032.1 uncharacterized protein LOC128728431 [Anopheles nili]
MSSFPVALTCLGLVSLMQLLVIVSGGPVEESTTLPAMLVSIETVSDIREYRKAHADLTIEPLAVRSVVNQAGGNNRKQIVYTLGARFSGDQLVAISSGGKSWTSPQDIKLNLQYPTTGVGASVTYVEVIVDQSSELGQGYVVSGGVGQRFIQLVIEAYNTVYFNYSAAIYGF